jgi:signal transduction histidine kinase
VLVDPTGTHLENGAAPSLPASFLASIIGRPVNAESGPCAMASYLNEQVIAADLATETRWAEYAWCPMALAHGLRACWSTPITSASGKVLGAFALYYDTPRAPTPLHQSLIERFTHIARIAIESAQNDAALKRSETFLAEVQRLSSTGSFWWNAVTGERTWSEEMYRIFEFDPAVPVTIEMMETRIHPEDLAAFRERGQRVRNVDSSFEFEYRLLMPDGSVKYIWATCHPRRYDGTLMELFGTVHDVTRRRLAEETLDKVRSQLAHVSRVTSLGALTGSIAHEVNQPLSGIVTNASTCLRMLAAEPPNVDGARETARRTIRDANRASDVITRLRALFAKKSAVSESVDLNEATREVVALSWDELQRNRVIVREELADDLPLVTGDRIQLQQVILNLLRNASDAMSGVDDRPRELMIKTEREEGDRVRLTVQDAGMGIDAHATDKLFEAFYTTKSDGMGIGLSVSRSIIESHSGRLWAVANDGPGATFAFSIPLVPAPRTPRSAPVRTAVRANPERSIGQP